MKTADTTGRAGLLVGLVTAGLAAGRFAMDSPGIGLLLAGAAALFLLTAVLSRLAPGSVVTRLLLPGTAWAAASTMAWLEGGLQSEAIMWLVFVPLVAALSHGSRAAAAFILANVGTATALALRTDIVSQADVLAALSLVGASVFSGVLGIVYERRRVAQLDERRKRDERLQEAAVRLQTVVDNVDQGIAITDGRAKLILINRRLCEVFGIDDSPMDLQGRNTFKIIERAPNAPVAEAAFRERILELAEARVATHGDLVEFADGRVFERSFVPIRLPADSAGHLWSYHEVTRRHKSEQDAWRRVRTDDLTGLVSRAGLREALDEYVERAVAGGRPFALLYIDLDGFKAVNDEHGHDAGDELLRVVASRLRRVVRSDDIVARIGGDEFAILLANISREEDAQLAAEKVRSAVDEAVPIAGTTALVTGSIGIALYPGAASSAEELLRSADAAMYAAKQGGKNRWSMVAEA